MIMRIGPVAVPSKRFCLVALSCFLSATAAGGAGEPILPPNAGVPLINWTDASKFIGQTVVVQGKIVATRNIGAICFLNFSDPRTKDFTAIVRQANYGKFPTPPETLYAEKWVRMRGVITEFRGKAEIEIAGPDQVRLLEKEEPIPEAPATKAFTFDGTVTIATFNTLNLFDEYDDPYHQDEGTPAKPRDQLEHLAATIHAVNADVIALEEVENRYYLERFVHSMLADMGYRDVVSFDGNDQRGIECSVLSRLPVGPVTSYRHVDFSDGSGSAMRFRRDLLQVQIVPPGYAPFTVFAIHLKSKRGEAGESMKVRVAEAKEVRRVADDLLRIDARSLFLVCGDFNDTWDSAPVSAIRGDGPNVLRSFHEELPKGSVTYNIPKYAEMIDFILASPGFAEHYVPRSIRVVSGSIEKTGSDHNPVSVQFRLPKVDGASPEPATTQPSPASQAGETAETTPAPAS